MPRKLNVIWVMLLMLLASVSYGQKREIEKAVSSADVPENAKKWLDDTYEGNPNVRWFFQTDGEKEVFEAKLKWKRKWHSVEFLPDGEILNIEILMRHKDLDKEVQQNLSTYLNDTYQRSKIDRIQIQYTGDSGDLEDLIDENEMGPSLTIMYEIEYFGRQNGKNNIWEGHFDKQGNFIKKRAIELRSTDVLNY